MSDIVVDHAIKNVWCNIEMDRQVILEPARLTKDEGVKNTCTLYWENLKLPRENIRYHVYQIGHYPARLSGIETDLSDWTPINELANNDNVLLELYIGSGVHAPKFTSYIRELKNKNLLVAVPLYDFLDLDNQKLYCRFYFNAFFASERHTPNVDYIQVEGQEIVDDWNKALLLDKFYNLPERGKKWLYVNGRSVEFVAPSFLKVGDVIEYYYDATVYYTIEIPLVNLHHFTSELDACRKYLVRLGIGGTNIEYLDDVEFYLIKHVPGQTRVDGVNYHRNVRKSVRMVTHEDYSIPTDFVGEYLAHSFGEETTLDDVYLQVAVRHSGYERELVFEHNRIHELFKMNRERQDQALLGSESTLREWQASTLEKSAYTFLMGATDKEVTTDKVTEAYGYNALSGIALQVPVCLDPDIQSKRFIMPPALQGKSTIVEYSADGLLLEIRNHPGGSIYIPNSTDCACIEGFPGELTTSPDCWINEVSASVVKPHRYRVYRRDIGTVIWNEITKSSDVVVTEDAVRYTGDTAAYDVMIRSDRKNLAYSTFVAKDHGVFQFVVTEVVDGKSTMVPVGLGELHIWADGKPLIRGLDYHVNGARGYIVAKDITAGKDMIELHVLARGLPESGSEWPEPEPHGFIQSGLISVNGRYDIKDDVLLRCNVGGKFIPKSNLSFHEDHYGYGVDGIPNGTPYQLQRVKPSLFYIGIEQGAEDWLRELSGTVDGLVEDYLTAHYPPTKPPGISPIPKRYDLYSPFCARIIHDLNEGHLVIPQGPLTPSQLSALVEDYKFLLEFDPATWDVDMGYVAVQPHSQYEELTISAWHFSLVERLCVLFLNSRVDLSLFMRIGV